MDKNRNLNQLFAQAKSAPVLTSFEETKDSFLKELNSNSSTKPSKKVHFLRTKKGIIMLGIIGLIVTMVFVLVPRENEAIEKDTVKNKATVENVEIKPQYQLNEAIEVDKKQLQRGMEIGNLPYLSLENIKVKKGPKFPIRTFAGASTKQKVLETPYIFPKLTPEEIEENNKRKKKMIRAARKLDSKVYAYIPSGSFKFNDKTTSVHGFMMQRKEVTNLEYKTFLFDLLIQGRKDDFLMAKPKQELCTEVLGKEFQYLQDEYFSDERYEDYPVVNISRKGAEMYCKWLSQERGVLDGKNDPVLNDLRLPYRAEWLKAATVDAKFGEYAWQKSASPTCFKGNFSTNGYNRIAVTITKSGEKVAFGDTNAISTAGYLLNKGDLTTKVGSYEANEYGLYDMSGNVSEMVYEIVDGKYDKKSFGTAGGGWMNTEDQLKFVSEDPYKGEENPHLNIGFRVVMSYLGKNWQFNPNDN